MRIINSRHPGAKPWTVERLRRATGRFVKDGLLDSAVLDRARASLPALYDRALPPEGRLSYCDSSEAAVAGADWVQESVSERLELKHKVYAQIAAVLPEGGFIASSTSGFKASDLAAGGAPVVVVHPFNPVYLLPLAEISGAPRPSPWCGPSACTRWR